MGLPEAREPAVAHLRVGRRPGNDGNQLLDSVIDGIADGPGGAVDILERGRHALQKEHRAFRAQHGIAPSRLLDLAHGARSPH
jgi:hypothetical protein